MSLFDTGVRPVIDQFLLEESEKERDYGQYWSASSAGMCMRKNIMERLKIPYVVKDARKQRVFSSGKIFHEWIQDITRKAGISIAQELELQDEELMIRGHIDDLVLVFGPERINPTFEGHKQLKAMHEVTKAQEDFAGLVGKYPARDLRLPKLGETKHLILYDYKTQNSRAFSYKRDDMSHFHKMQLGTYVYMLRKKDAPTKPAKELHARGLENSSFAQSVPSTKDLTEARILSISRDDLRMDEKQLIYTPDLEKEVVEYWRTLNGYWKAKTLPKCTCGDFEGGFMALEKWNPYFYDGEPCSTKWYELKKEKV